MRSKVLLVTLCAILCAIPAQPASAADSPAKGRSATVRCYEDAPCWNWATMGNRSRGIVTRYGTPMVVGPCRFASLYRRGLVDYPRSQRMRGDASALRMCR